MIVLSKKVFRIQIKSQAVKIYVTNDQSALTYFLGCTVQM